MSAEWKPGDVALWTYPLSKRQIAVRVTGCGVAAHPTADHWHLSGGGWDTSGADEDVRPLVVIDPEDREQVERLAAAYRSQGAIGCDTFANLLAAALREFANPKPPKPPADVSARVTDRRGNIWRLLADGEWVCVDGPDIGEYIKWDRLVSERGPLEEEVQP